MRTMLDNAPPAVKLAALTPWELGRSDCEMTASRFLETETGVGLPDDLLSTLKTFSSWQECLSFFQSTHGGTRNSLLSVLTEHPYLEPGQHTYDGQSGVAVVWGRVVTPVSDFYIAPDQATLCVIGQDGVRWARLLNGSWPLLHYENEAPFVCVPRNVRRRGDYRKRGQPYCRGAALSKRQCEMVRMNMAKAGRLSPAGLGHGIVDTGFRRNSTGWIYRADAHQRALFETIDSRVREMNEQAFGISLFPVGPDALQFSEYMPGDRYREHTDTAFEAVGAQRKVSFSILLSDPAEFRGGALVIEGRAVPQDTGEMVAFPSIAPHAVEPVRTGRRLSLVGWYEGPAWR